MLLLLVVYWFRMLVYVLGNLHDGMSYPGSNSLSLQPTAAPVTVPPANTHLSQHSSQYLQGNSVSVGHPSTFHLATHVPVTSTQAIQIQTHPQGPTPSSTPPAVPNDSKGSHQYPQRKLMLSYFEYMLMCCSVFLPPSI